MFERIVVRQQKILQPQAPLDLGALVEAMLFYGQTTVVADSSIIRQLARAWTPEGLIELVRRGHVRLQYRNNFAAIFTETNAARQERHDVIVGQVGSVRCGPLAAENAIPRMFEEVVGRAGRARRLARQLIPLIDVGQLDDELPHRTRTDFAVGAYIEASVIEMLRILVPRYARGRAIHFRLRTVDKWIVVDTNIDFELANAEYHTRVSASHSSLTVALLLGHFVALREALEDAILANAEMATDPLQARLLSIRFERVFERRIASEAQLAAFQDFVVDDARAIREAVNQGYRGLDDILALLEEATKFRSWLAGQPANVELVKAYHRECVARTWADRLPSKAIRWCLFTGIGIGFDTKFGGAIGTALSQGVSAVDTFLVDGLIRGWRPNQFIESSLEAFTRQP